MNVRFFLPYRPIPKQSYRASKFGGYQPKRVTDFKSLVILAAKKAAAEQGWEKSDGPLLLRLVFKFRCPASAKKADKEMTRWHIKRPDLDNIEKAITDGLAPLMGDDSQVCSKISEKIILKMGEVEGVDVLLETLPSYKEHNGNNDTLENAAEAPDGQRRPVE